MTRHTPNLCAALRAHARWLKLMSQRPDRAPG